jgi:tripartite-type tricarboxylate transporter receptor subunit TctC
LEQAGGNPDKAVDYPSKPLNHIECFNPGGETDITARIQEPVLKKYYKEGVVISYKVGGVSVGWAELVASKPTAIPWRGTTSPTSSCSRCLLIGVAIVFLMVVVFQHLLDVPLPPGTLFE